MARQSLARRPHRATSPRRRTTQRRSATSARRNPAGSRVASSRRTTSRKGAGARFVERGESVARRDPGIEAFLERFTKAVTAGDGDVAASYFEYPAVMVMAGGQGPNQSMEGPAAAATLFDRAPQQYAAMGIASTFPDVLDVDWVAHDLAMVRTRFPYIDVDGNDTGDAETSIYAIRRRADTYAICCAITLGTESQRTGR